MVSRPPIPSPRQRRTRLDNRWGRLPGEWKLIIKHKSPLEDWGSVGRALLGSAPHLDSGLNVFIPDRYERRHLSRWLKGSYLYLNFQIAWTDSTSQLLLGVVVALPLVAVRLVYGVSSLILELNGSSSEFMTSLAIKVCLSVVPEMLLTVGFVVVGINTRKIWVPVGRWTRVERFGSDDGPSCLELLSSREQGITS